jgi:hypothetical protein
VTCNTIEHVSLLCAALWVSGPEKTVLVLRFTHGDTRILCVFLVQCVFSEMSFKAEILSRT